MNQTRINVLSSQNDILSKLNDQLLNVDDSKQAAARNLLGASTYATEQSETESDSTATSFDFTPTNTNPIASLPSNSIDTTINTALERQSSETQEAPEITKLDIGIQSTITTSTIALVTMTSSFDTNTTAEASGNDLSSQANNMNTNIVFNATTITNSNITSDDLLTTTESPTTSDKNLPLILGLTLGLGLPICLGIIGGLVYYFKIYRPKHSSVGFKSTI
ncbi:unnamed protein product [Rotaria sp. Silwood1]|nr:unnamed protein product [Rotaria sp. Silwood1]CAF4620491.1 unnamed protein product [Rotaria sp. Silwood1]CAF5102908.1 unnamed protein product [Rotaria sp. Silwood1]